MNQDLLLLIIFTIGFSSGFVAGAWWVARSRNA